MDMQGRARLVAVAHTCGRVAHVFRRCSVFPGGFCPCSSALLFPIPTLPTLLLPPCGGSIWLPHWPELSILGGATCPHLFSNPSFLPQPNLLASSCCCSDAMCKLQQHAHLSCLHSGKGSKVSANKQSFRRSPESCANQGLSDASRWTVKSRLCQALFSLPSDI